MKRGPRRREAVFAELIRLFSEKLRGRGYTTREVADACYLYSWQTVRVALRELAKRGAILRLSIGKEKRGRFLRYYATDKDGFEAFKIDKARDESSREDRQRARDKRKHATRPGRGRRTFIRRELEDLFKSDPYNGLTSEAAANILRRHITTVRDGLKLLKDSGSLIVRRERRLSAKTMKRAFRRVYYLAAGTPLPATDERVLAVISSGTRNLSGIAREALLSRDEAKQKLELLVSRGELRFEQVEVGKTSGGAPILERRYFTN